MGNNKQKSKEELINDLDLRVKDKILEKSNYELLKKLILNADTINEAISIAELGTTYKRTGFHFDKRLEKFSNDIKYFKKNNELSFVEKENLNKGQDIFTADRKPITHKLIIGDNYDALLNLLIEYRGKIDIIYIDPPYGKDNMGNFAQTNYDNAITRDNLLSMLYPRLVLARQLLSNNGVIFCSIDDRNQAYIKCLFDEIFQESNFIGQWNWYKSETPPNLSLKIKKNIEYIICYQAYNNNEKFYGLKKESKSDDPFTKPQNTIKELCFPAGSINIKSKNNKINKGIYGTDKFPNELLDDIFVENDTNKNDVRFRNRFVWTQEKLNEELSIGTNINLSKNGVLSYKKIKYNPEAPPNFINAEVGSTNEKAGEELINILENEYFKFPKPVSLIKYLIGFRKDENKDFKILDFFAGSGTTGQAVLELNKEDGGSREFILCTNNEITEKNPNGIAKDVTTKRLKRVMSGVCYDGNNNFQWLKKNSPLGDNLDVYDIEKVANFETTEGKTPFDIIDENLYGKEKFKTIREKIQWVIDNFEITQKDIEEYSTWEKRQKGEEGC
ncbi:MAG: site-specific DNA-methyltransferase [Bacteroidales bacterium]|jgi:adenine-specific DNA-methyltransferase|nr:site-specific DNA-methyltransferase [Bacteroidales bacterium]